MWTTAPSWDSGWSPMANSRGLSAGPLPAFPGGGVFCTPGRAANEPKAGPRRTPPALSVVVVGGAVVAVVPVDVEPPPPPPHPATRRMVDTMARRLMAESVIVASLVLALATTPASATEIDRLAG